MIFALQRYMFRELLRILILATVGLTLILSLGMILQPVQKFGVGPRQAVHILIIFIPVTLTFVLPMAALFASALAYGRFASDNEIDACRASGIGAMTLIYPGLALAVLVAIGNLMLSFHVMPYFVHMAEKSLKADAKQILFRNIQRRGYYSVPGTGYQIYADYADLENDTLYGIVIVQAPKHKGIRRIITSDETQVQFDPHERFNEVRLTVHNCRQMDSGDHAWEGQVGLLPVTMGFQGLLGDSIKFKKIDEMKQIQADLMRFDPVARLAREAYTQYVTELLAKDVNEVVVSGKSYEFRAHAFRPILGGSMRDAGPRGHHADASRRGGRARQRRAAAPARMHKGRDPGPGRGRKSEIGAVSQQPSHSGDGAIVGAVRRRRFVAA